MHRALQTITSIFIVSAAPLLLSSCTEEEPICVSGNCGSGSEGGTGGSTPDSSTMDMMMQMDTTPSGGSGGSGGSGNSPGTGNTGGGGPSGPVEPDPDLDQFQTVILPIIVTDCGASGCHGRDPRDNDKLELFEQSAESLSEQQFQVSYDEVVRLVEWNTPSLSPLLTYGVGVSHPFSSPWFTGDEDYTLILNWIADAVTEEIPDAGIPDMSPGGGGAGGSVVEGLPCDGLPNSDPLNRPGYYEAFETSINPMLITQCSDADCHGTTGAGDRLWYSVDQCSTPWNFAASQLFIDPRGSDSSPLLTKPLSQGHGGREVFQGRNDRNYILLRDWINLGLRR